MPPAKTVEESIDLARHPFVEGQAMTACFVNVTRKRSKVAAVPCDPITLAGYEGFRFGLHLEPGHRFRWHVTELSSGASVTGHCPSRDAALAKLRERVGRQRPSYFQRGLDMWRDQAYARSRRAAQG